MNIFKESCRSGNYFFVKRLCSAANISMEKICFVNGDRIIHQAIKMNNRSLIISLLKNHFNIEIDGEFGTPIVTAIHFNRISIVKILLFYGADLSKRHIDWPYWTLDEYCIQFSKIQIKLLIDQHRQRKEKEKIRSN